MEWLVIVAIITIPPMIVSVLGCSFITIQTQRGPSIVSSKKKRLTSAALMNLGAKGMRTKGIATHMMHISGIMIKSFPFKTKLSANKRAISVTISLPIMAEGTRLIFFADLIITAAEVNLFFLLETILGPLWVWLVIKEQPSFETIFGGSIIIVTIATHSFLALKKT